jgi:hypothetical protein
VAGFCESDTKLSVSLEFENINSVINIKLQIIRKSRSKKELWKKNYVFYVYFAVHFGTIAGPSGGAV